MSNRSFLFSLCDFHLNYAGCSNADQFLEANSYFIALHSLSLFLYAVPIFILPHLKVPLKTFFKISVNPLREVYKTSSYLSLIFQIVKITWLATLRQGYGQSFLTMTDYQIQTVARNIIYVDCLSWAFGGATVAVLLKGLIATTTVIPLYSKITINGKTVDPERVLGYYRLFISISIITTFSLFAWQGVLSLEGYITFRRIAYILIGLSSMISPLILIYFGTKLYKALKKSKDSEKKVKLQRLKVFFYMINILYVVSALISFLIIIINENFQQSVEVLLATKVTCSLINWFLTTYGSVYFIYDSIMYFSASNPSRSNEMNQNLKTNMNFETSPTVIISGTDTQTR